MTYTVKSFRDAGLEARWTKRNGAPFISVRNPNAQLAHQRNQFWLVDRTMFERMEKVGAVQAFEEHTLLGDIFSLPVA